MKNAPDKLQWHPAFCAAAGLEFHEDIERLELKPEYNLSKEPIRIDLLIIKEESDRQNVEAVLQVSVKANDELYREIRRDANMCDALRELMKDDLEDARKLGELEGEERGKIVGEAKIILKMNHSGMSPESIASITGKDLDEINAILEGKVPVLS